MARPIVVFNCARNYGPGALERDMPRLVAQCEVRLTEAKDGADLARELADADVLVARRDYVGLATLDRVPHLSGIVTPGVGVEKVDVKAATEQGIVVANSPGNSITVAESTLLLMLALAKQMPMWIETARAGHRTDQRDARHGATRQNPRPGRARTHRPPDRRVGERLRHARAGLRPVRGIERPGGAGFARGRAAPVGFRLAAPGPRRPRHFI